MLTVTLKSPLENVLHVELTHFAGCREKRLRPPFGNPPRT